MNTAIIVKERPTTKARLHLQNLRSVLKEIGADVLFRSDITDAIIHSLSDHIKVEKEREFWEELFKDIHE